MSASEIRIAKERKALMSVMDEGPYRVPKRMIDENILVATWNIQHFSNRKTKRSLQYIADICERFDLIAIQEVKSDLRGLSRLMKLLPGDYRMLVTDPTGNSERLAFLYDRRTVTNTGLVCEIGFHGTAKKPEVFQLHRMPYCASFKAGRFDFSIASVHIVYGQGKEGLAARKKEIEKLADFIKDRSEREASKVFDRDFIVVGDFNIVEEGDEFFNALDERGFYMPPQLHSLTTNFTRTKTYDKFAWVKRKDFKFTKKINVVPFYKAVYQEKDPPGGRKEISDHLPLWAEFQINELTQELNQIIKSD